MNHVAIAAEVDREVEAGAGIEGRENEGGLLSGTTPKDEKTPPPQAYHHHHHRYPNQNDRNVTLVNPVYLVQVMRIVDQSVTEQ